MAKLIQAEKVIEGEFFCKWLQSRLLRKNKNVLGAELGPTGSGKSYRDLRKVELWYEHYLKKAFPYENICFGVKQALERLNHYHQLIAMGQNVSGEVLIFEEAGANLGSLDFQNKVSKIFTYVLQSFRSMNIAIFFNLPYLSMLNKSARLLLHYSSESIGIDMKNKKNKCKLFFHQVNQVTGKLYRKYPRIKMKNKMKTIKEIDWEIPKQELIDAYEKKKANYLREMNEGYIKDVESQELKVRKRRNGWEPSEDHKKIKVYLEQGLIQREIAKLMGKSQQTISGLIQTMRNYGYITQNA